MDNKKYIVYCHKNKINGKRYIGITCNKNPNVRWKNGKGYIKQPFYYAIQKYGWDNFEHEILFKELNKEDAERKEIELISKYKTTNRNVGYNIDRGGSTGCDWTGEELDKIKERVSGGNNPMAKKVYCNGIIFDCMRDCAKYYNKDVGTMTDWIRGIQGIPDDFKKMKLSFLGEEPKYKDRKKYGMNRKTICDGVVYDTATNCANHYGVKPSTMTKWLNGTNKIPKEYLNMGLKYLDMEQNTNILGSLNKRCTKIYCSSIDMYFKSISECIKYLKNEMNIELTSSEISAVIKEGTSRKGAKGLKFYRV